MDNEEKGRLQSLAIEIRKDIVRMIGVSRSYGLASALAVVDILVYLYWAYMNVYPSKPNHEGRDRFVLSKGAATPALYACLARLGFFSREELWSYRRLGAMLQGYPDIRTPGVDAPWGAYGGGVGIASGLCESFRMDGLSARAFCLLGDGELQEGVVWESIFSAASRRLDRLFLVVDANGHEDRGPQSGLKNIASLAEKFRSFEWSVVDADGHDFASLERAFESIGSADERPKVILARTRAGSGLPFLKEAAAAEVSRPFSRDDMDRVLSQLESSTRLSEETA